MKDTSKFTLTYYWKRVSDYKSLFFVSLIFIPVASLIINTGVPYFFSQAIGRLSGGSLDDVYRFLEYAAVLGLGGVFLNLVGFQALTRLEARVGAKIRSDMFSDLVNKDLRFFIDQKIGAMTGKYIDFFRSYVTLQDLLIIRSLGFALSLVTGLVILASKSWLVAGLLLGLLVGLVVEVKWSINKREPWREARKKHRSELFGKVADTLTNNLVVKAFAGEHQEIASANRTNKLFKEAFLKDIGFIAFEGSMRIALMVSVQLIAITLSAHLVSTGAIDIATAVFIISYLQLIGSQLFSIGELLNGYEQALLDASPMSEMLMTENVVVDKPGAHALDKNTIPEISLEDVSFQYQDSDLPALQSLSLVIPAGQKVGLVGHSGSGKTTLSNILLRFSDVTAGSIRFGSHDIRDISQQSLHEVVAYVPQESTLFHRSLRDNIAYARPEATDANVIHAAKQANAWEFIQHLPHGLDTTVGERGVKLSGGQRQRIAIARAILKDAPILVLDEATSALDSESEKMIQASLENLMKGRTSIVIAHRLSTIAKLDRIIVLDKGKVIEDGTHAELLTRGGIYAKLWKHQSGGFIKE